jgi:hypothetical protein
MLCKDCGICGAMNNDASRVAVFDVFLVRAQVGEGWKIYCYTGNTKVPVRTSNSQRYMKYKWNKEK